MHLYILVYISSCNQGSFHTFVLFHFYTKNIYIRVNFYNKIIIIKQLFPNIKSNYHEFGIIFSRQLCVVAITYIYMCVKEKSFLSTRLKFLQIDVVVGLRYTLGNFQQTAWWQR